MTTYVGLDVSLRSVAMCVVDRDGSIIEEVGLPCDVEVIANHLRQSGRETRRLGCCRAQTCHHPASDVDDGYTLQCEGRRMI